MIGASDMRSGGRMTSKVAANSSLATCANTSINYVSFETPSSYMDVVEGRPKSLVFARRKTAPCIIAERDDVDSFVDSLIQHGCADAIPAFKKGDAPSLVGAVDYQKAFVLGAFYLMLQDRLYQTHYDCEKITFKSAEICEAVGIDRSNRTWARKAFIASALIIGAVWVELSEVSKAAGRKKWIHIIQTVCETRGGFEVAVDAELLPILKKAPKIEHDVSIYKVAFKSYPFAFRIGRKLEEIADRQKLYAKAKASANTLFALCTDELSDTYKEQRNYSKRIEWLEANLNHLKETGLLLKWRWEGRPTCLEEEADAMVEYTFASKRKNLSLAYKAAKKH